MPNSSVIVSAEYERYTYNITPAVVQNGTIGDLSHRTSVPIDTYVTFKAVPVDGYRVVSTDFSLRDGSRTVKPSSGFFPTGNPNEYGFIVDFTVAQYPNDKANLTLTGGFTLASFPIARDPGTTGVLVNLSHTGNVLFNSLVTITFTRTNIRRYAPGSVTLNDGNDNFLLTQEQKQPNGTTTVTFRMPARAITIKALSESIPLASVDLKDPNMDDYIHFLDEATKEEISYVTPGSEITVEAYTGSPSTGIEVIPLVVQSWWMDSVKAVQNHPESPRVFIVPDPCYARAITVMVTIGDVPHSVTIPVRFD